MKLSRYDVDHEQASSHAKFCKFHKNRARHSLNGNLSPQKSDFFKDLVVHNPAR